MCGKGGWISKWKESKFEKLWINFELNKEGRTVTMLGASKKEITEKLSETEVDGRKSPSFNYH